MKVLEKTLPLKGVKELLREEDGMGTVEIILIIVVIFTIYMGCK